MVVTPHGLAIESRLIDSDFLVNPYPVYTLLRDDAPVCWCPELGFWIISRYEDVKSILADPSGFSSTGWDQLYMAQLPTRHLGTLHALEQHFAFPSLVSADPPEHARLRRLVYRVFTPRSVEQMRCYVENTVKDLLDAIDTADAFDAIRDLAVPLPVRVFAHMFGLPSSDHDLLKTASADFTAFVSNVRPNWNDAERANRSLERLQARLRTLLSERRKSPRADLASVLVSEDESGDFLEDDELLPLCVHMLISGHETTTNLIGNGSFALLSHPLQLALLREQPSLISRTIEEILRWEAPLQRVKRIATMPAEVNGMTINRGDRLMLLIGAANRDTSVFEDADAFNIIADRQPHLAFGHGIHFCIGAALARLEGQIVFNELLRRYSTMKLQPDWRPKWNPSLLRGLKDLIVQC